MAVIGTPTDEVMHQFWASVNRIADLHGLENVDVFEFEYNHCPIRVMVERSNSTPRLRVRRRAALDKTD